MNQHIFKSGFNKKLKNEIQTTQKKFARFCINLDKTAHVSQNKFKRLNWFTISIRINEVPF